MPSVFRTPNGRFCAVIRMKALGRHSQTFDTEHEARDWAERKTRELLAIAIGNEGPRSGITVGDACDRYLASPTHANKAASTQRRERQAADNVKRHLGRFALDAVDPARIQLFIDARSQEKNRYDERVSGDTVRLEKAFISAVFAFAKRRGFCRHNPAHDDFEMPRCHRRETRITTEQQVLLMNEAIDLWLSKRSNKNLLEYLWTLFATGCRPGELARVEVRWLALDRREKRVLHIEVPRRGSKNRKPRIVPIPTELSGQLYRQYERAVAAGSPFLFWSVARANKAFVPYRYNHMWRKLCARAGLPDDAVPHSVRHSFISTIIEKMPTMSDSQVAALMGDLHPISLEPYKHLRVHALKPQVERFAEAAGEDYAKELERVGERLRAEMDAFYGRQRDNGV